MLKVVAIANQKGGVGKTTTAVNLASALVQSKRSCLLIDLDAQGTATRYLLGLYGEDGKVIYDVLLKGTPLESVTLPCPSGVMIVPANLSLATLDMDLIGEYNREHRLEIALENLKKEYDYVIIDCPPNLGFTTINAFVASDLIIIPIECKAEAWEAVPRLMTTLKKVITNFKKTIRVYALPTFLERTNLARDIHEQIQQNFEAYCLPPIHKNTRLAESFAARQPILLYDPTASGAMDYLRVAKEIIDGEESPQIRRGVEGRTNR
jgi:chromosome partitioning protein